MFAPQSGLGLRILMTLQPAWSHLNTLVPIARALAARGHEVRVATADSMTVAVSARGLTPVAAGFDWDASHADDYFPGYLGARGASQARLLISLARRGMVDDLVELSAQWRPDVIVRDASEFGAVFAGALLDIPVAVLGIGLRPPVEWMRKLYAPKFTALREQYGLPPVSEQRDITGDLWLSSYPSAFAVAPPEEGVKEVHVRPVVADIEHGAVPPAWLDDVGPDAVYVSLGTVFNRDPDLLRVLVRALSVTAGLEVIVTTGSSVEPDALGTMPCGVRVASYIPQSLLAPHVKAVVSHGGFNTMMGAISAGLPVCILPLGADHPQNASRCVDLGLGTAVTTHTPPWGYPIARPAEVTEQAVLAAVLPLIEGDTYRMRAEAMAAEIGSMPAPVAAIGAVEALAGA